MTHDKGRAPRPWPDLTSPNQLRAVSYTHLAGRSTSWVERDRASMSELAHGRPGYAMGLDASKQMKWIELTPAHAHPRFRGYLERERDSSRER